MVNWSPAAPRLDLLREFVRARLREEAEEDPSGLFANLDYSDAYVDNLALFGATAHRVPNGTLFFSPLEEQDSYHAIAAIQRDENEEFVSTHGDGRYASVAIARSDETGELSLAGLDSKGLAAATRLFGNLTGRKQVRLLMCRAGQGDFYKEYSASIRANVIAPNGNYVCSNLWTTDAAVTGDLHVLVPGTMASGGSGPGEELAEPQWKQAVNGNAAEQRIVRDPSADDQLLAQLMSEHIQKIKPISPDSVPARVQIDPGREWENVARFGRTAQATRTGTLFTVPRIDHWKTHFALMGVRQEDYYDLFGGVGTPESAVPLGVHSKIASEGLTADEYGLAIYFFTDWRKKSTGTNTRPLPWCE